MPEDNSKKPTLEDEVKLVETVAAQLGCKHIGHREAGFIVRAFHSVAEANGHPEFVLKLKPGSEVTRS
jgi:hypothetical protein